MTTNGKDWTAPRRPPRKSMMYSPLPYTDGRSRWACRSRALRAMLMSEVDAGNQGLPLAFSIMVHRAIALLIACEMIEEKLAKGEPADLELLGRSINTLSRTLRNLGLRMSLPRIAKRTGGETLAGYLAAKYATQRRVLPDDNEAASP